MKQKNSTTTSASTVTQSPIKFTQRTRRRRSAYTPTSQKSKQLPSWPSSVKSGKFSPGARPTCPEYLENLQNTRSASSQTPNQQSGRCVDSQNPSIEPLEKKSIDYSTCSSSGRRRK